MKLFHCVSSFFIDWRTLANVKEEMTSHYYHPTLHNQCRFSLKENYLPLYFAFQILLMHTFLHVHGLLGMCSRGRSRWSNKLQLECQLLCRVPWQVMQHSVYLFQSLQRLMTLLELVYNHKLSERKSQQQGEQMTIVWSQMIDPKHRCSYGTSQGLFLQILDCPHILHSKKTRKLENVRYNSICSS